MKTQSQIERRLPLQPGDVSEGLIGLRIQVLSVQVHSLTIFTPIESKARRVQAGADPELDVLRPIVLFEQSLHGQRSGWFVAVDASGDRNAAGFAHTASL